MNNHSAVESIFIAALQKQSAERRAAYLDQACGPDLELRRCVERLLSAHPKVGSFLFGGLSAEEAGAALGLSRAVAYRNWKYARAWLREALEK
jgi:hypothetical protein